MLDKLFAITNMSNPSLEGTKFFETLKLRSVPSTTWYVMLYALVGGLQPRHIIDVGTQAGRSALVMAASLADHKIEGVVHTIDVADNAYHTRAVQATKQLGLREYVQFYRRGAPADLEMLLSRMDVLDLLYIDEEKKDYARDFLIARHKLQFCAMHDVLIPGMAEIIQPQLIDLREKCLEFDFFLPLCSHFRAGLILIQRKIPWPTYS